jgi:putative PIN family toxin of toxin-antitoxin system
VSLGGAGGALPNLLSVGWESVGRSRSFDRRLVPLATPPLFLEYEDVLKRPEQRLAHGLAPDQIDDFLAELAALIEPVEVHFHWRPQTRDPSDETVLEAAINGQADALVTYNVRDFELAGERFGIPVLDPVQLLKKVKR